VSYYLGSLLIGLGFGLAVTIGTWRVPGWTGKERLGLFLAVTLCLFVIFVGGRGFHP
jgi:hypothetical protein